MTPSTSLPELSVVAKPTPIPTPITSKVVELAAPWYLSTPPDPRQIYSYSPSALTTYSSHTSTFVALRNSIASTFSKQLNATSARSCAQEEIGFIPFISNSVEEEINLKLDRVREEILSRIGVEQVYILSSPEKNEVDLYLHLRQGLCWSSTLLANILQIKIRYGLDFSSGDAGSWPTIIYGYEGRGMILRKMASDAGIVFNHNGFNLIATINGKEVRKYSIKGAASKLVWCSSGTDLMYNDYDYANLDRYLIPGGSCDKYQGTWSSFFLDEEGNSTLQETPEWLRVLQEKVKNNPNINVTRTAKQDKSLMDFLALHANIMNDLDELKDEYRDTVLIQERIEEARSLIKDPEELEKFNKRLEEIPRTKRIRLVLTSNPLSLLSKI